MNTLNISPIKAYLTRNTEMMSNMDPFIEFQLGSQKCKTKTIQQGGRRVEFEQTFTFRPQGDNRLTVIAFDEDQVTDDQIGTGYIDLNPYFQGGILAEQSVSLKYAKKPAGKVIVRIEPSNGKIYDNRIPQNKKGPITFYKPEDILEQLKLDAFGKISQGGFIPTLMQNSQGINQHPMPQNRTTTIPQNQPYRPQQGHQSYSGYPVQRRS